ncbi:nucleotidyltransferase family protein [Sphingomonas cavernae]|uniref:Nucleotidyltransferase family protein n=1 Tax=Sphingomonas cavernae TaxID=2320861 RepID=A0A418W6C9_9SPHN|nr:nucleotidyltransferase family protein [Sphingomonas cavernae]RJF85559.1 hypothetical protein D3876_16680 [Sphingomonas cavernae]
MKDALSLARALCDPGSVGRLDARGWTALIAAARAEQLIGTLAYRLKGLAIPDAAERVLADARASAEHWRRSALWEAEAARRALGPLDCSVILLKGTAFAAAGLDAGAGRAIGDLDILVPRDRLDDVERALLEAGWEWVKPDPYDDAYYRRWMHELPPLIHRERDRMIDVHHTILPPTARITPDAAALIEDSVALQNGLRVLSPPDMICHAVTHLFADGDLSGGLRNLWDIDRLLREYRNDAVVWEALPRRAERHGIAREFARAMRLTERLFGSPIPVVSKRGALDPFYVRRLAARDGWGRETRKGLRLAFYARSHWLRMPPLMLAEHLWRKARR